MVWSVAGGFPNHTKTKEKDGNATKMTSDIIKQKMFFEKLFAHIDDNMREVFEEVVQVISENSDEILEGKE